MRDQFYHSGHPIIETYYAEPPLQIPHFTIYLIQLFAYQFLIP